MERKEKINDKERERKREGKISKKGINDKKNRG